MLLIQVAVHQHLFHHFLLVIDRTNLNGGLIIKKMAVLLKNHETGGVVGPHPGKTGITQIGELIKPALHLLGRLVGKGDGQNTGGVCAFIDQVKNLGRQGSCLT